MTLASIALDRIGGSLALIDPKHARFSASALSTNGPTAAALGSWERDVTEQRFVVDSLGISIADARWHLTSPARIAIDSSGGLRINSTTLRNRDSAVVVLAADVPAAVARRRRIFARRACRCSTSAFLRSYVNL